MASLVFYDVGGSDDVDVDFIPECPNKRNNPWMAPSLVAYTVYRSAAGIVIVVHCLLTATV